jgi:hypothetical protein
MNHQNWLLTVSRDGDVMNILTELHPVEWIAQRAETMPRANYLLLFAMEVTPAQRERLLQTPWRSGGTASIPTAQRIRRLTGGLVNSDGSDKTFDLPKLRDEFESNEIPS